jgi:hypothetical protein
MPAFLLSVAVDTRTFPGMAVVVKERDGCLNKGHD